MTIAILTITLVTAACIYYSEKSAQIDADITRFLATIPEEWR